MGKASKERPVLAAVVRVPPRSPTAPGAKQRGDPGGCISAGCTRSSNGWMCRGRKARSQPPSHPSAPALELLPGGIGSSGKVRAPFHSPLGPHPPTTAPQPPATRDCLTPLLGFSASPPGITNRSRAANAPLTASLQWVWGGLLTPTPAGGCPLSQLWRSLPAAPSSRAPLDQAVMGCCPQERVSQLWAGHAAGKLTRGRRGGIPPSQRNPPKRGKKVCAS